MSIQKIVMGVSCLLLFLYPVALANIIPVTDSLDGQAETGTQLAPIDRQNEPIDRQLDPIFSVWAYAKIHDGTINTRSAEPEPVQQDNSNNQCLWAIVSCCNAQSNYERDNCFEALGCPGAWFQNLCSQEYIDVANSEVTNIFTGGFGKK